MDFADRVRGCLLGGAVGDALGAPVEFATWSNIQARYGSEGVTDLEPPGRFTDDTQMTLFTCEGLIRASVRGRGRGLGIWHPPSIVRQAYLRWLHTQGVPWPEAAPDHSKRRDAPDGWLVHDQRLHRRMAPGNTCLSALASGGHGTTTVPINDSKGCGGVMRVAPVGLFNRSLSADDAYRYGCEIAALTHGHPDGWHAAGALAVVVQALAGGASVAEGVAVAAGLTSTSIRGVLEVAMAVASDGLPEPSAIEQRLGAGWVADEALAIAVCCALAADDFASGVLAAVNHSGDTDSTGAICGNILGALHGEASIPGTWLDGLDARDLVSTLADDLAREASDPPYDGIDSVPGWWTDRYPPS